MNRAAWPPGIGRAYLQHPAPGQTDSRIQCGNAITSHRKPAAPAQSRYGLRSPYGITQVESLFRRWTSSMRGSEGGKTESHRVVQIVFLGL